MILRCRIPRLKGTDTNVVMSGHSPLKAWCFIVLRETGGGTLSQVKPYIDRHLR
jgi:hypothetical protein